MTTPTSLRLCGVTYRVRVWGDTTLGWGGVRHKMRVRSDTILMSEVGWGEILGGGGGG